LEIKGGKYLVPICICFLISVCGRAGGAGYLSETSTEALQHWLGSFSGNFGSSMHFPWYLFGMRHAYFVLFQLLFSAHTNFVLYST